MADFMTDEGAGDWGRQLAGFVYRVKAEAEGQRRLDAEEEEALELLVRALVGAGPLRTPRMGTFEAWVAVLDRLRTLGYVRGAGAWYRPTLAGIRRGLLLIRDANEPGEPCDLGGVAFWPIEQGVTCKMMTKHSSLDPTPDVECGGPGGYVFSKDPEHVICALCYSAMADDREVQQEYAPIATYVPKVMHHSEPLL